MRGTSGISSLLGVWLTASVLAGCGGGSSPGSDAPLVGMWRAAGLSVSDQTVACPGALTIGDQIVNTCGGDDTIVFASDGTFTGLYEEGTIRSRVRGSWALSGGNLTTTVREGASDLNGNETFEPQEIVVFTNPQTTTDQIGFPADNTLTIQYGDGALVFTDTYQRQ